MSGLFDLFPVTPDSSVSQSTENGLVADIQKLNFAGTNLIGQSLTLGIDIQSSIPNFYLEPQEEGGFVAFSREFPGAVGQGETVEEAIADIEKAIRLLKEVFDEDKALQEKK